MKNVRIRIWNEKMLGSGLKHPGSATLVTAKEHKKVSALVVVRSANFREGEVLRKALVRQ
jgi:hypothetical protein